MCLRKRLVIYYVILPQNVPDTYISCTIINLFFFLRTTFNAQVLMQDTALVITFHCKANHNQDVKLLPKKKKKSIIQQTK